MKKLIMVDKKILMLVRTSGLEYDDRIRKEILSLNKLGYTVEVLANYTSNKHEKGLTSYGTQYNVFKLYTRELLPSARLLPVKMFEFWLRVFINTFFKKYEYVWLHEEYMFLNAIIKPVKAKYILDLHELPNLILKQKNGLKLYNRIEKNVFKIIVANEQRLSYMKIEGIVSCPQKYVVLNNFPDNIFGSINKESLPQKINEFLDGSDYVLLQGGGHISRFPDVVLKAVSKTKKYKIIIVGPIDPKIEALIDTSYKNMVFKAGYVPQLQLPLFFDHAKFTIILYDSNDPNSLYCEPNRLYQAIIRGIPVIVGSNPPMKRIVNDEKIGLVLQTDGRDSADILLAIHNMEKEFHIYKKNVLNISNKYKWEMQEIKIRQILD